MPRNVASRSRTRPTSRESATVKARPTAGGRNPRLSDETPFSAVIERAREMGLMTEGTQQVGARLPTKLLDQAKKQTGISSTTDLLAFALANVAVEDNFAKAFIAARGKLDPDLDIGF